MGYASRREHPKRHPKYVAATAELKWIALWSIASMLVAQEIINDLRIDSDAMQVSDTFSIEQWFSASGTHTGQ